MADLVQTINKFSGIKNDEDSKQVSAEYLTSGINVNYPDTGVLGLTKILMPDLVNTLSTGVGGIDGLFEYRYLNTSGSLTTEYIGVTGGKIYKNAITSGTLITTAVITTGLCSFVTFKDKCYIANGNNYVKVYNGSLGVVSEMGAPFANASASTGLLTSGIHFYAQTYIVGTTEEIIGSVSNVVTNTSAATSTNLTLPLGYDGVTSRKIYRTVAGSTSLKLLTTISDNTTTTYADVLADSVLTTAVAIPSMNNELAKPYFLAVANQSLYGAVVNKYPTQVFKTDTNYEVWDTANYIDVANYSPDNTPIRGIGVDFSKVIVGTDRNIYIIEPSDTVVNVSTVKPTRAYVGIKSGYTVKQIPANIDFPQGGLMFVSSLNDVRMMSGIDELPVVNVLGNISTQNWAQNIRGSLETDLSSYSNIYAEYYGNKYHLQIDNNRYVLDLRTRGWTQHKIVSASYVSVPKVMAVMNNLFYNGQTTSCGIEKEYTNITYRGETVNMAVESPYIGVDSKYKYISSIKFWFNTSQSSYTTISVEIDDDTFNQVSGSFSLYGGIYNPSYYNSTYFNTSNNPVMDYKVINIQRPCRWLKYTVSNTTGKINLQRVDIVGTPLDAQV